VPDTVLELSHLEFTRIVASPSALDAALGDADIRISPDEAFSFASADDLRAELPAQAIVETDAGWSGAWLDEHTLRRRLASLIDWPLQDRPSVNQGSIAGVPAKVWLPAGTSEALLMVPSASAHELQERLS
jgi:hypothetical protein